MILLKYVVLSVPKFHIHIGPTNKDRKKHIINVQYSDLIGPVINFYFHN